MNGRILRVVHVRNYGRILRVLHVRNYGRILRVHLGDDLNQQPGLLRAKLRDR